MKSSIIHHPSAIDSWDAVQCAMEQYADQAANLAQRRAWLDDALAKVRATYAAEIAAGEKALEEIEASMEAFALAHKTEFKPAPAGDGRSFDHAGVTVGFRKMPPSVKLPHRTADREAALNYLQIYRPSLVRLAPEFDKPAILRTLDDGGEVLAKALGEHGIKLNPGKDEFFVKTEGEK